MSLFDPHTIAVASGHFIGGRLVADTARLAVLRHTPPPKPGFYV